MDDVVLTTERLVIRPFTMFDADDVFGYANDERFGQYLSSVVPFPYSLEDARRFLNASIGELDHYPFAIEHQGHVVGSIGVRPNDKLWLAELGWALARKHWGKGLMTEAVEGVLGFCFGPLELEKVFARSDVRNVGSWRVMEKVGMTREALLRQHRLDRYGVAFDEAWYGILRTDFEGRQLGT